MVGCYMSLSPGEGGRSGWLGGGQGGVLLLRTRTKNTTSFFTSPVFVVVLVFIVVCFFVVHPRHGRRGTVRIFHGDLDTNRRMIADNNVCNAIGRIGGGIMILRVTPDMGVGISGSSMCTSVSAGTRLGWGATLVTDGRPDGLRGAGHFIGGFLHMGGDERFFIFLFFLLMTFVF